MPRKPRARHMNWLDKATKKTSHKPNWDAELKRAENQFAKNKRLVLDGETFAGQGRKNSSKNPGAHRDGLYS